jgi:hypothetical protein
VAFATELLVQLGEQLDGVPPQCEALFDHLDELAVTLLEFILALRRVCLDLPEVTGVDRLLRRHGTSTPGTQDRGQQQHHPARCRFLLQTSGNLEK